MDKWIHFAATFDGSKIKTYVNEKQPLDKAGSYGIQEVGDEFVEHLEGKMDTVMGLPVQLVTDLLYDFEL